jgi:hypothetical protein
MEQLLNRVRDLSPVAFALPIGLAMLLADLLPELAGGSALLALVATLIWFPVAVASFCAVTWLRSDNWVIAGFVVGLTPVLARLCTDLITRNDLFATTGWSVGVITRAVIAVPLCGGVVFGARWLTELISGADTRMPRRQR